jgi:hypothetical protein
MFGSPKRKVRDNIKSVLRKPTVVIRTGPTWNRLRVFQNKAEEVTGTWRRIHGEKLHSTLQQLSIG